MPADEPALPSSLCDKLLSRRWLMHARTWTHRLRQVMMYLSVPRLSSLLSEDVG